MSVTTLVSAAHDRRTIRELASKWMDIAAQPVMQERKRQWKALHDLKPERPMILIETSTIDGFVGTGELQCKDPFLRAVEQNLRDNVRHAEEVGDDVVLEPYFRIGWDLDCSDFGVDVVTTPAPVSEGEVALGYTFNFPIREPKDVGLLKRRTFAVDRARTLERQRLLEDAMGDLLPVRVGNYDHFLVQHGDEGFVGNFFLGLTWQIYRFIGNDGLLYWLYDAPDTIRWLMEYMCEDRERLFAFLEREMLLVPNTDSQMAGPRAYGYVSELPGPDTDGEVRLKNLWCWAESQETSSISPDMYKEFFLPYLARLTAQFGLVYYGCCEPVHDRLELIMQAIPNLRSVSVSSWADFRRVAEMLGRQYVYSRKPNPAFMSGANPDWSLVEADMRKTYEATRDCNVELLFRDIYTIAGDRPRLARWVAMTRSIFGI
jgi:hypothetical protein